MYLPHTILEIGHFDDVVWTAPTQQHVEAVRPLQPDALDVVLLLLLRRCQRWQKFLHHSHCDAKAKLSNVLDGHKIWHAFKVTISKPFANLGHEHT